jgi:hypothetical protein
VQAKATRAKSVDSAISSSAPGRNQQSFPILQTARSRSLTRTNSRNASSDEEIPPALNSQPVVSGISSQGEQYTEAPEEGRNIIRFPVATLPRAEQPKDELKFRRERDAVYSRRKRERKRIHVEELQKQELHLTAWNDVLRSEGDRLEELLCSAQEEIKRKRGGGGGGSGELLISEY